MAFDILHLDGWDLRSLPALERKAMLWDLVKPRDGIIQYSQHVERGGAEFYAAIDKMGLEGMVSKRRDSKYRSGNSTAWLKTKAFTIDEYELLGVEREAGKPAFALMAERGTGRYVGSAFITLNRGMRERLWERVREHVGPPPKGMRRPATQCGSSRG
ncbi:hypothetical protein [Mesorhizobium waimense]|uniref:ATP-dependent DNA ligase n=1 Tax=Mesorhizobium waimense TaxID=1300307 RepID=UPI001FDF579A|nr:hypothetical protein [Mesorhizobium waimense]